MKHYKPFQGHDANGDVAEKTEPDTEHVGAYIPWVVVHKLTNGETEGGQDIAEY